MTRQKTALVCGAGGFVGSHMVKRLKAEGYWVRGVDLKYPEFLPSEADEFLIYDLRDGHNVEAVMRLVLDANGHPQEFTYLNPPYGLKEFAFDEVIQLACDMGGAGYIFTGENDANVMTSAAININVAEWAKNYGVGKIFYSSSACMYPQKLQNHTGTTFGLAEWMAYPAEPDSEYGWEKLFSERLYLSYARNYGLNVRIARFHNIYGPEGTYRGGKEKAPAAICRKVAQSKIALEEDFGPGDLIKFGYHPIEIWGSGDQTRSFLYIDDCINAVRLLMQSDFTGPVNIGSEEMISINDLAKMVIEISGKNISIKNIDGPVGVRGRNSDNTLIENKLGWKPKYSLRDGMELLYKWIHERNI